MFGNKNKEKKEDCVSISEYRKDIEDVKNSYNIEIKNLKNDHEIEKKKIMASHEIELNEKEFEIRHKTDDEILDLKKEVNAKDQEIAVLKQKVEMLDKIVDINSDIIDVKQLVSDLIGKLPEIKITNLGGSSKDK